MKNKELIKKLMDYNSDADVTLTTSEDILLSFVGEDKASAKIIFIEPSDICMTCFFYEDGYCSEHKSDAKLVDGCDSYLKDD